MAAPAATTGPKPSTIATAYAAAKSSSLRGFQTPKQAPQFNAKGPSQVTHEVRSGPVPHISMHPSRGQ